MRPVAQARNEAVSLDSFPTYTFHMNPSANPVGSMFTIGPTMAASATSTTAFGRRHRHLSPGSLPRLIWSPHTLCCQQWSHSSQILSFHVNLSRTMSLICSKSSKASFPSQSVRSKVLQRAINVLYDL